MMLHLLIQPFQKEESIDISTQDEQKQKAGLQPA